MSNDNRAQRMRVLVAWGSERGGTEGIARIVAEVLQREGLEVTLASAGDVRDPSAFDAAIVGGALYANRWHRHAHRFVARNVRALRRIPVWLFSSGPLDESADDGTIASTTRVAVLADRIGAVEHVTFGGRLSPDAKGFPASAMAKTHAGDWRNPEQVRAWATRIARALPDARPRAAADPPGRSWPRLVEHALVGWALCAALMGALLRLAPAAAVAIHAIAAPIVFSVIAVRYFRARGAREPLPTALAFVAIVFALDAAVVAGLVLGSFAMFASFAGTWLPLALVFATTWITGLVMSTMPWPKPTPGGPSATRAGGAHA